MNILLVHHLEDMWSRGYQNNGTSFENEAKKVINHIKNSDYDKVILVRFEDFELGDEHLMAGLQEHVDEVQVYGYGWERAELEEQDPEGEGVRWADGCSHSEVVMLDDWIKDLANHKVTLVGAFEDECIATISAALDQCEVPYERENSLIVGTGVEYEFVISDEELKEILEEDMDLRIDTADHQSMPEWPDNKEAITVLHELIKEHNWEDREALKEEAASKLLGVFDGDDVVVDVDDLWVSEDFMGGVPDYRFTPDMDPDEIPNVRAPLVRGSLQVDIEDYGLFEMYRRKGFESIAVKVSLNEADPYAHYGFPVNTQENFSRSKKRLERMASNLDQGVTSGLASRG